MRNKTSLALLLVDVDSFKSFNDIYGHPAGDDCLRVIANVLVKTARRAGETVARCGGEEFTVLLPGVDRAEASALARRLCQTVRDLHIPHAASPVAANVTISAGVAAAFPRTISILGIQGRTALSSALTERFTRPRRRAAIRWRKTRPM